MSDSGEKLKFFLAAGLLAEYMSEVGAEVSAGLTALGLGGSVDILMLIILVMAVWEVVSSWFVIISKRMNPHAKYWNSVVSKLVSTITFLFIYLIRSYLGSIVYEAQHMAEFSAPTIIVLRVVGFLLFIALTIYFEEFHGIAAVGARHITDDDREAKHD